MHLAELKKDQIAEVSSIAMGQSSLRIMELGIVAGAQIALASVAPTGDPMAFRVGDAIVSLRKSDASLVNVQLIA
jgi:ferrous iron transport protein A